jgi:hypothetical protein
MKMSNVPTKCSCENNDIRSENPESAAEAHLRISSMPQENLQDYRVTMLKGTGFLKALPLLWTIRPALQKTFYSA